MAAPKRGDDGDGRANDERRTEQTTTARDETATTKQRDDGEGLCDGDARQKARAPAESNSNSEHHRQNPSNPNPHFQISSNNTKSPKLALQSPSNKAVIASTMKTSVLESTGEQKSYAVTISQRFRAWERESSRRDKELRVCRAVKRGVL
ncbi:hypothetical protein Scep_026680 [Stephania cephalantha]|uniref:Uncharacterized protein n=1 Tax=Stephania cephalantha TaxID=152367 RepID=A0AAP0EKM6_9MAGN